MHDIKKIIKEALKQRNKKCNCGCGGTCSVNEEYSSASKLYQIKGNIVIDTDVAFHKQIMSDIRAIRGITIVKDYIYEPVGASSNRGYATIDIKIDPSAFQNKDVNNMVATVINDIKHTKGVRAFTLKKGPISTEV
jgi:hypothetical protein